MPVSQIISLDARLATARLAQLRRVIDNNFMQYIVEAKRRGEPTSGMEAARMIALGRIDAWYQEELTK